MSYKVIHEVKCPRCGHGLTNVGSIQVHISAGGHQFDLLSRVDDEGLLQEVGEGLIAAGLHAGSCCRCCDAELEELVDDDEAQGDEDWYVKWESTRGISGPMTKEQALDATGNGSGMIFSSGLFDSTTLSGKVHELLMAHLSDELARTDKDSAALAADLERFSEEKWSDFVAGADVPYPSSGDLRKLARASEAILVLSAKKSVTSEEVEAVLTDLRDLNSHRPSVTMRLAIDTITSLSREKAVLQRDMCRDASEVLAESIEALKKPSRG